MLLCLIVLLYIIIVNCDRNIAQLSRMIQVLQLRINDQDYRIVPLLQLFGLKLLPIYLVPAVSTIIHQTLLPTFSILNFMHAFIIINVCCTRTYLP